MHKDRRINAMNVGIHTIPDVAVILDPYDKQTPYYAYAVDFETRRGLTGISHQYNLPPEYTHKMLDQGLRRHMNLRPERSHHQEMLKRVQGALLPLYQEIVKLNPSLQNVRVNEGSFSEVFNALRGVASQFNPSDID
jgi:hypothetical protein